MPESGAQQPGMGAEPPMPPSQGQTGHPMDGHIVHWHPHAPPKPPEGAPCNGCGLCCLDAPCPLGMLVSRRRTGPCVALRWSDAQQRYLCAMVADPGGATGITRPWAVDALAWLARRWIAAGAGCDASVQAHPVEQPPTTHAESLLKE